MTKRSCQGAILAAAAAALLSAGCAGLLHEGAKPLSHVKCYGVNACKGQGECGSTSNACKGQNSCRGTGWIKLSDKACLEHGGDSHPL